MICWSCEKQAGAGATCTGCGALQPPDAGADHFTVLGVERRFDVDVADLERRYKDLTRVLHPDRWARADARARRFSLQRSVQLNDAWRTLRDPVKRADYLLGRDANPPPPPSLLMETMELREQLGEARGANEHARVEVLAADVRGRRAVTADALAVAFANGDHAAAAAELVKLRYYDRFLEEVAAHEEAREQPHG
jgi:molecular chaperone HscB